MTHHQNGPPEKEVGPDATNAEANQQAFNDTTTTAANDSRPDPQAAYDARRAEHVDDCDWCTGDRPRQVEHVSVQLRRRREAAYRLPRLHDGRRDPISQSRR
jgi:hypothetical protein